MKDCCAGYFDSPIGDIWLLADKDYLYKLSFEKLNEPYGKNSIIDLTILQLKEYFFGDRRSFDIPIKTNGTIFQESIWKALRKIDYGKTISYEGLAILSKNSSATRATANACGKNPIPIIIPCHRVIRKNGDIGGFSSGISLKKKLLLLES